MSISESASPAAHSRIAVYPLSPFTHADALALVQRLVGHPPAEVADHADAVPAPEEPSGAAVLAPTYLPWTIRNKYYEADVHFCIQGAEAWAPDETTRAMGAAEAPAVIVLAEATRVPAEPTVSGLANLAAAEPRPDVCLLVTLRRPPSSRGLSHEQVPSGDEWEDLALEHGFEWVQVDAVDAGAEQERDDEAEQDGIAQVSAALHAHMWEGLRRRDAREDPISLQAGAAEESDEDGQDSLLPPPSLPRGECHPSRVETEPRLASLPKTRPHSADLDPNIWSFPSTFLPSVPRTRVDAPAPIQPANDSGATAFDDDFSPFLSGPTPSSIPSARTSGAESGFASGSASSSGGLDGLPGGDNLEALLARISLARTEASGMDMDARRQFAARMVRDLLGDDADLDGLSDEES
ncbi:hypothetical protein JCM8115_007008 [Rhodotorula mucilaginosa]|uniref:Alpha and gamma adaptin binding protein p34 n=1 Tax=Rhodotorula mucilaginosa TaxID=5537 RepID=A0A9P6W231_RHOMI|nr:hypothetical protein C6P46_004531 [Rhodotorula mucilaginosa]